MCTLHFEREFHTTHPSIYYIIAQKLRLVKEVAYYQTEVQENEQTLADMKASPGKDEYDIKKFAEVVAESHMMIPDSQSRLQQALRELKDFLEEQADVVESSEWYQPAQTLVQEHSTGRTITLSLIHI